MLLPCADVINIFQADFNYDIYQVHELCCTLYGTTTLTYRLWKLHIVPSSEWVSEWIQHSESKRKVIAWFVMETRLDFTENTTEHEYDEQNINAEEEEQEDDFSNISNGWSNYLLGSAFMRTLHWQFDLILYPTKIV